MVNIHATAIARNGCGILIKGRSGSGKSDLALRLITEGMELIADDRVNLKVKDKIIYLTAPKTIQGLIEVHGIGIINQKCIQNVPLRLIVNLRPGCEIERFPHNKSEIINNVPVPSICVDAFEVSTIIKIEIALEIQEGKINLVK